jgi:hypothetical protein
MTSQSTVADRADKLPPAAITSAGLSKRFHSGRDTDAGDLSITGARAHSEHVLGVRLGETS